MKLLIAASAALGATLFASPAFAASAAVSPDMCSPLTQSNMEQCCAADNWKDVIKSEDVQYCPPLKDDTSSGRKGAKMGNDTTGSTSSTGSSNNDNSNNNNNNGTSNDGSNNNGSNNGGNNNGGSSNGSGN